MDAASSQTLKILFAKEQAEIDRDLRNAEGGLASVTAEIERLAGMPIQATTAQTQARLAHLIMVWAWELNRTGAYPPELDTYYVSSGAELVVWDVQMVADRQERLADLTARMEAIKRREGLEEDECWRRDEGPADHRQLEADYERELARISDTFMEVVLRRYRLDEYADQYERDRRSFEIQREIGRRVVHPSTSDEAEFFASLDGTFERQYGSAALHHMRQRAGEIRKGMEPPPRWPA